MNLQELRKTNKEFIDKIEVLKREQELFKFTNQDLFNDLFEEKKEQDRKWFVEHFDYILKYKDFFKCREPFKDIVIDFLTLYKATGYEAGAGWRNDYENQSISLSDLFNAWENGYTYNGKPLIGYKFGQIKENKHNTYIYIDNNKEYEIEDNNYDASNVKKISKFINTNKKWDTYKTIDILKKKGES